MQVCGKDPEPEGNVEACGLTPAEGNCGSRGTGSLPLSTDQRRAEGRRLEGLWPL